MAWLQRTNLCSHEKAQAHIENVLGAIKCCCSHTLQDGRAHACRRAKVLLLTHTNTQVLQQTLAGCNALNVVDCTQNSHTSLTRIIASAKLKLLLCDCAHRRTPQTLSWRKSWRRSRPGTSIWTTRQMSSRKAGANVQFANPLHLLIAQAEQCSASARVVACCPPLSFPQRRARALLLAAWCNGSRTTLSSKATTAAASLCWHLMMPVTSSVGFSGVHQTTPSSKSYLTRYVLKLCWIS